MATTSAVLQTTFLLLIGQQSIYGAKWINSFAGPFITTMSKWEPCGPEKSEQLNVLDFKVSQFRNPTMIQKQLQTLTGNANITIPIANTGHCYMKAASRSQNQWKENALIFKLPSGPCRTHLDFWPDFTRKVYRVEPNDHPTGPCIIPTGLYTVTNTPVNWSIPKINVLPYGQWKVEIGIDMGTKSKPRTVMCFFAEAVLHPKL